MHHQVTKPQLKENLMKKNNKPSIKTPTGLEKKIYQACINDDSKTLEEILNTNPYHLNMSFSTLHCHSPLHLTIINNKPKCTLLLLKKGANIFNKDAKGKTPIEYLDNQKLPQYQKAKKIFLALCNADKLEKLNTYLNKNPWKLLLVNTMIKDINNEIIPLTWNIVLKNDNKVLEVLKKNGANLKYTDRVGDNILDKILKKHDIQFYETKVSQEIIDYLISNKIFSKKTLNLCARYSDTKTFKKILNQNIYVNTPANSNKDTVLHMLCQNIENFNILVNQANFAKKQTGYDNAPEKISLLLEKNVDTSTLNSLGYTALDYLIGKRQTAKVKDTCVSLLKKDSHSNKTLMSCIENQRADYSKILILKGEKINQKSLQTLAKKGAVQMLNLVIDSCIEHNKDSKKCYSSLTPKNKQEIVTFITCNHINKKEGKPFIVKPVLDNLLIPKLTSKTKNIEIIQKFINTLKIHEIAKLKLLNKQGIDYSFSTKSSGSNKGF